MNINKIISGRFFVCGLVLAAISSPLIYAAERGETAASFLEINPSVRAAALGGNQAALSGDVDALPSNPAGLATLSAPQLLLSHQESLLDTRYESLLFAWPGRSVWAVGAQYVNDGQFDRTEVNGSAPVQDLGDFRVGTTLLRGAWSRRWNNVGALGVGVRGWQETIDGDDSSGWSVDAGFQRRVSDWPMTWALALRNLGPSIDGYSLPASAALGAAYRLRLATLFAEADAASYRGSRFRGGVEFQQQGFRLRAGYETGHDDTGDALDGLSAGGGFQRKGWAIDYAWRPSGVLGDEHRFSVRVGFGMTDEERAVAARHADEIIAQRMTERCDALLKEARAAGTAGRWSDAVRLASKAVDWDPTRADAQELLAESKTKEKTALAQHHFEMGERLLSERQPLEAALHFEETLRLSPTHAAARRKRDQAKKDAIASRTNTSAADDSFDKGVLAFVDGDLDRALRYWDEAHSRQPDRPHVREYIEKAKRLKAERELARLQQKERSAADEEDRMMQQGYTLYTLGQVDRAIHIWEEVRRRDPNHEEAAIALKQAQEKKDLMAGVQGPKEKRVRELNAEAMNAYVAGDLKRAADLLRAALKMDEGNPSLKNSLRRIENEIALQSK